jgi:hypothetical protein
VAVNVYFMSFGSGAADPAIDRQTLDAAYFNRLPLAAAA